MPRHRTQRRHKRSRSHNRRSKHHRRRSHYKRGGSTNNIAGHPNPSSYSDGASYVKAAVGSTNTQYENVFKNPNNTSPSNGLIGLQGQKISGGRKYKKHPKKSKKGGYWSQVVNQAVVPFTLWGMQSTYRSKRGGKGTRKRKY